MVSLNFVLYLDGVVQASERDVLAADGHGVVDKGRLAALGVLLVRAGVQRLGPEHEGGAHVLQRRGVQASLAEHVFLLHLDNEVKKG